MDGKRQLYLRQAWSWSLRGLGGGVTSLPQGGLVLVIERVCGRLQVYLKACSVLVSEGVGASLEDESLPLEHVVLP